MCEIVCSVPEKVCCREAQVCCRIATKVQSSAYVYGIVTCVKGIETKLQVVLLWSKHVSKVFKQWAKTIRHFHHF